MDEKNIHIIKIYRRSRFEWLAWFLWLLSEIFWAQNAIASYYEYHARAGLTFWAIFALSLMAGIITYFMRRVNLVNRLRENELHPGEKQ